MGTGCQRSSTLSTVDQQTSHLQVWKGLENSDGNVRFPFKAGSSSVMISIEVHEFCSLLDSGAAVTAVNTEVWQTYLHHHAHLNFKSLELESVTSVDGLNSQIFRFEAFFSEIFFLRCDSLEIFFKNFALKSISGIVTGKFSDFSMCLFGTYLRTNFNV